MIVYALRERTEGGHDALVVFLFPLDPPLDERSRFDPRGIPNWLLHAEGVTPALVRSIQGGSTGYRQLFETVVGETELEFVSRMRTAYPTVVAEEERMARAGGQFSRHKTTEPGIPKRVQVS